MPLVNLIISLDHLEQISPPVGKVLKLMAPHIGLEGVLEQKAMVELNVKVDGSLAHIANAEGHDRAVPGKGRIVFVLGIIGPCILVYSLIFDHMQIKHGGLSLD